MRQGAALLAFAGVALVLTGLGVVLYMAGGPDPSTEPETGGGRRTGPGSRRRGRPLPPPPDIPAAQPFLVKAPAKANARFDVPGRPELKYRDWNEIAAAFPDFVGHARNVTRKPITEPPDEKEIQRMQRITERFNRAWSAPIEGMDPHLPTIQTDHPGFVANICAATLDRAKQPLSDEQAARIQELVRVHAPETDEYDKQWTALMATDPLERTVWILDWFEERAKAADVFFDELYKVLTPAQAEAFVPSEYRFRANVDPLSSMRFWSNGALPLPIVDLDDGANVLTDRIATQFDLIERRADIHPIVAAWLSRDPLEFFDPLEEGRAFTRRRCATARRRMSELVHSLVDQLDPPLAVKAKLRESPIVFIPVRLQQKK